MQNYHIPDSRISMGGMHGVMSDDYGATPDLLAQIGMVDAASQRGFNATILMYDAKYCAYDNKVRAWLGTPPLLGYGYSQTRLASFNQVGGYVPAAVADRIKEVLDSGDFDEDHLGIVRYTQDSDSELREECCALLGTLVSPGGGSYRYLLAYWAGPFGSVLSLQDLELKSDLGALECATRKSYEDALSAKLATRHESLLVATTGVYALAAVYNILLIALGGQSILMFALHVLMGVGFGAGVGHYAVRATQQHHKAGEWRAKNGGCSPTKAAKRLRAQMRQRLEP